MTTAQTPFAPLRSTIARGELASAHALLRPLLEDAGLRADALLALAVVERRLGDVDSALARFRELLSEHPNDASTHNNYADCLLVAGDTDGAVRHYKEALKLRADYLDALLSLGMALKNQGNPEDAKPILMRAVELAPLNAKVWECLGLVQRELGDLAGAARSLDESLKFAPNNAQVVHSRALVEAASGKPATSFYVWARALAPDEPEINLGLAIAKYEEGDSTGALALLERVVTRRRDWAKGHTVLSQMRWQLGERATFARSFDEALRAQPDDVALQIACFGTLMRAGCYAAVLERLPRARAAIDAPDLFDRYEAVCASECSDVERADRAFARQKDSEDTGLQIAHLRHLLRTSRPFAAAQLGEVMVRGPAANEAWPYLGIAWRLTGNPRSQWLDREDRLIASFDFPEMRASLPTLAAVLRGIHHANIHSFDPSLRNGAQTDEHLFRRQEPELVHVRRCIDSGIARYLEQLPSFDAEHPFLRHRRDRFRYVRSYSVRLRANGFHINHVHPDAGISCCFYVETPQSIGAETINPAGWLTIGQPPAELGLNLPALARIKPQPGRLALFPSLMWHGTKPFKEGERLTVVSDLIPIRS